MVFNRLYCPDRGRQTGGEGFVRSKPDCKVLFRKLAVNDVMAGVPHPSAEPLDFDLELVLNNVENLHAAIAE